MPLGRIDDDRARLLHGAKEHRLAFERGIEPLLGRGRDVAGLIEHVGHVAAALRLRRGGGHNRGACKQDRRQTHCQLLTTRSNAPFTLHPVTPDFTSPYSPATLTARAFAKFMRRRRCPDYAFSASLRRSAVRAQTRLCHAVPSRAGFEPSRISAAGQCCSTRHGPAPCHGCVTHGAAWPTGTMKLTVCVRGGSGARLHFLARAHAENVVAALVAAGQRETDSEDEADHGKTPPRRQRLSHKPSYAPHKTRPNSPHAHYRNRRQPMP